MTILTSARLRFEPMAERHLAGLYAMNGDPEVMRYIGGRAETIEETAAMIARVQARWARRGYDWWSLIDAQTEAVIGAAGLYHLGHDPANAHEIGWRLQRERWGQGLAQEAARTILQHAFTMLGAPVVCAIRHPDNLASRLVMERLGMRPLGLQTWQGEQVEVHELARADWSGAPG